MKDCTKKRFPGKEAAITFHQINNSKGKPYRVYQCSRCYPDWHITTTGLHESVTDGLVRIIQGGDRSKFAYLGRVSKKRTILLVRHRAGTFVVVYHKGNGLVDVLKEVMKVDTIEDVMASVERINNRPIDCLDVARNILGARDRKETVT